MHSSSIIPANPRPIARWLMLCIVLVAMMVALGGITRLTESGLSIVEWKLFSGTFPPMSEAAWQAEFEEYKSSPQFQQVNRGFDLGDFKGIYWLEYLHRLLGRIIGLAVLLPLIYFTARRMLPRRLFWRGVAIAALVGAQGTVGWVMVASGLTDQPRVEPVKLAAHLLLAFSVFCLLLWTRWQVLGHPRLSTPKPFAWAIRGVLLLTVLQIFMGALVAGLRAGLSYTTYPRMDGQFIPDGLHLMQPWWINHLESILTVQFQHRMGALMVSLAVIALVAYGWRHLSLRRPLGWLLFILFLQFSLGVATLLSGVNLWLASAHQLVALALLAVLIRMIFVAPLDVNQHHEIIRP